MRLIDAELALVADAMDHCGESPVWVAEEDALYWVNTDRPAMLRRWRRSSGTIDDWPMPRRIGGFVRKAGGGVLLCLADGLYDFDLATRALRLRAPSPLTRASLHECRCDRQGRLWVGSIDHCIAPDNPSPGGGALFRLDGDRLIEIEDGISCSNGLAFSPDGRTMYHSDSTTGVIVARSIDAVTGTASERRDFVRLETGAGFCDGATVDADGGYWAALVFAGKLHRYDSGGHLDLVFDLPFDFPTKPAFGGESFRTLYLTTTRMFPGGRGDGMLGKVYALNPGHVGLPDTDLAD